MSLERSPNTRRRLDGQEMLERDEEIARLRERGVSFRAIALRLGCSLGSVQKAMRRVQARNAELTAASAESDHTPQGSISFVGVDGGVERFADERGRRFTLLDLYRHSRFDGGALYRDAVGQLPPAPLRAEA